LYFAFLFNSSSFAIRLLFGFQVSGCIACSFLLILLVLCFLGFRSQVACLRVQCSFPSLVRCFLSSRPQFALLASFVLAFRVRCLFAFMFLCFSDPGLRLHVLFFCCYPCSLLSSLPGLRLHFCILNIIDISPISLICCVSECVLSSRPKVAFLYSQYRIFVVLL